jgi:phosphoribosylformimino-5-aminoimidazole carboxamide ribotide isomerase
LHPSCEPIPLARAIRDGLGLATLYVADLDAIEGGTPGVDVYRMMIASGLHIWIDAGVRDVDSMAPLLVLDPSSCTIIAGLETLHGPRELAEIVKHAGGDRVIFSLDLFAGNTKIAPSAAWGTNDPLELAAAAIECGLCHLLILDLSRVGTSRGTGTNRLLLQIRQRHPSVVLTVGGGISRIEDVVELRDAGAGAVLVGSAIHDGRIGARELRALASGAIPTTNC